MYDAVEAIRARGYIQDLPAWLTTDGSILAKDELNSTLSVLYYFINQMERVIDTENKLELSPREPEMALEVSGFGFDDIDLQTRLSRVNADREHLLNNQQLLMDALKQSRSETALYAQRLASSEVSFKESTKSITNERDILRKQVADFKQRETQFQHEIRRLELDNEKLRDQLRNALSSGAKFSKPAISSLPEGFSKPSTSSLPPSATATQASRPDSTAQKTLRNKIEDLERENEQLRVLLSSLTEQVDELLGTPGNTAKKSGQTSNNKNSDLSSLQLLIKRQMEELRSSNINKDTGNDSNEVDVLKAQLEDCKRMIEEQHKLLTLAVCPEPNRIFALPEQQ